MAGRCLKRIFNVKMVVYASLRGNLNLFVLCAILRGRSKSETVVYGR